MQEDQLSIHRGEVFHALSAAQPYQQRGGLGYPVHTMQTFAKSGCWLLNIKLQAR